MGKGWQKKKSQKMYKGKKGLKGKKGAKRFLKKCFPKWFYDRVFLKSNKRFKKKEKTYNNEQKKRGKKKGETFFPSENSPKK